MIAAGRLNQRITIEQPASEHDAAGQPIRTWSTLVEDVPAAVESVAGNETIRGRQVSAEATTLFTTRYRADVTTRMRVSYEGRTLNIVRAADPYGDRRELRIECREEL